MQPSEQLNPQSINGVNLYSYANNNILINSYNNFNNGHIVENFKRNEMKDKIFYAGDNMVASVISILNVFEEFDRISGYILGSVDGTFKFLVPNGVKGLSSFSSIIDKFSTSMIVISSILSCGSSVY